MKPPPNEIPRTSPHRETIEQYESVLRDIRSKEAEWISTMSLRLSFMWHLYHHACPSSVRKAHDSGYFSRLRQDAQAYLNAAGRNHGRLCGHIDECMAKMSSELDFDVVSVEECADALWNGTTTELYNKGAKR